MAWAEGGGRGCYDGPDSGERVYLSRHTVSRRHNHPFYPAQGEKPPMV